MTESWDPSIFDRIYADRADPWAVDTSAYEIAKYDETLAALPAARFARALEIGCSIGAQTIRLAARCDQLLAVDVAAEALRRARERCADCPNVEFRQARVPQDWPDERFDLIVISEVLYFLSADDIATTARLALGSLNPGGAILLVNWTGFTNTPTTGDAAADLFMVEAPGHQTHWRKDNYRIDLYQAEGSASF